jgi:basic amino acid/polyamine antiporter, APA family
MAADGLFLKSVAHVHPHLGTPARAVLVQGIVATILIALGSFEQIIAYFFFVTVLFLGITVAGLFVVRRRPEQPASTILTPSDPAMPVAFLVLVAVMLALLAVRSPHEAILGCVLVAGRLADVQLD